MTRFIVCLTLVLLIALPVAATAQNKYVGAKACMMCHQSDKQGKQKDIWMKSAHSNAFKALLSDAAVKAAKAKGIEKPSEAKECLQCHTTQADAAMMDKTFDVKDGVQCETCHGAGSAYKTMGTMKDKAKAVAAGLRDFKDMAAVEAFCKTCHNEKSPTFKGFKFEEMWGKIKHPIPKG